MVRKRRCSSGWDSGFDEVRNGFPIYVHVNTDEPPRTIHVYLTKRLPIFVHGGLSKWRVYESWYDKNGKRYSVAAVRLDSPPNNSDFVVLSDGRTSVLEDACYRESRGLWARLGTPASRILSKLVRMGCARVIVR